MKRAVVLTHEDFEGPSRIAEVLADAECAVELHALHRNDRVPAALGPGDLLVVMGGPMGVGDREREPFSYLSREVDLLRRCIAEDAPVLGICLGAQLLAHAAGAAVGPMRSPDRQSRLYEVGWSPVRFHADGNEDVLAGIPGEATMLHWHGDTFALPEGARRLASSAICDNQGFRLRQRLFGLQFHCEISPEDIEAFLREDREFVIKAHGENGVEQVRSDTARHIDTFQEVSDRLLRNIVHAMIETPSARGRE